MTAVTIVAPLLTLYLVGGLVVRGWSVRLWAGLILTTLLILVANVVLLFR